MTTDPQHDKTTNVLDGARCEPCGRPKKAGRPFCPTCFAALTLFQRIAMSRLASDPRFADDYASCLRHLQLNSERQKRFALRPGDLPYHSIEEFERAGYKFVSYAQCPAGRCGAEVLWFWTPGPDRRRIRINASDLQLHKPVCRDPEYFDRRRARAQTSAKRRKTA